MYYHEKVNRMNNKEYFTLIHQFIFTTIIVNKYIENKFIFIYDNNCLSICKRY